MEKCPVCDNGNLFERKGTHRITYKGVSGRINFYYSVCNECGSEVAGGWQTRVNKDNVLYFHKLVIDGKLRND